MRAAEVVMQEAYEQGLRHFFGIPGGGTPLDLMEAGRRIGVDFVAVAHESSAGIAAAYYGLLKKSAGLAMSIRGVGAANMVGGVANAYFERMPLVTLCEAAARGSEGKEAVQICDQKSLFEGVVRYQATLSVESTKAMVEEAFFHAVEDRPVPSILHIPAGIGEVNVDAGFRKPTSTILEVSDSDYQKIEEFVSRSKRPAIVVGADVVRGDAITEVVQFAERIGACALVTMDARGVFPESHRRWAGVLLGLFNPNVIESHVFQNADAVIMIGVDAMMTHSAWQVPLPTCEITASPAYTTMSSPDLRVNGSLKKILKRLASSPVKKGFDESEIENLRAGILKYFKRPANVRFAVQDAIEITRELLPADGILLSETGAFVCMLEHLWPVNQSGTFLGTSGGRTMGLMIPAALGARMANTKRPMVGFGADGSLLMRLGELELFARNKVAVPLVIINDQALGTMKARQRARGFADYGLDFHTINYAMIARACGLQGVIVESPEEYRVQLAEAMKADRATLIDVRIDQAAYQDSFGPTIGDLSSWKE